MNLLPEIRRHLPDFPEVTKPWEVHAAFLNHNFDAYPESQASFGVYVLPGGKLICGKNCKMQPCVVVNGTVVLGDNVFVGAHSILRGPLFLGDNCVVGSFNDIARSVVGPQTSMNHRNDILDSVIGARCWLHANVSIANVRLDKKNIEFEWEGERVKLNTNSFGAIIGDDVIMGLYMKIMPGAVIPGNQTITGPCLVSSNCKIKKF